MPADRSLYRVAKQTSRLDAIVRKPLFVLGLVVATAIFAIVLYWPSLSLPLLFDDLLHIRLVKSLDLQNVWLPSDKFGFYRPFVFLPLILIKSLFGYYPSQLLHGLSVAQHALNVALVAALAWRMWRRWTRALVSGLLLAVYPFAYQAIAFYGNNVYPTSAGIILLALHTYLLAIQASPRAGALVRSGWWILTGLLFSIGLLTHETVVLFGPLAILVHLQVLGKESRDAPEGARSRMFATIMTLRPALVFSGLGAVYAIVYQFLPTGGGPTLDAGGNALWPKILYLVQSAVYPFAWFAHRLQSLSANSIIVGGLALTVALTLWAGRRRDNRLALLLGWGWWALATILIGINLPTYYLEHGARLLYLGGVGVALLWAVLLDTMLEIPRLSSLLWFLGLVFIVVSSGMFVRDRLDAFADISRPLDTISEIMVDVPDEEGILLVNLPSWMSPERNVYATGVEYVTLMGGHLFVEELIEENLQGAWPVSAIRVPDLLSDPGYPYGVFSSAGQSSVDGSWSEAGSHLFTTSYADTGPETRYSGWIGPAESEPEALASFEPYDLLASEATYCSGFIRLTTSWQVSAAGSLPTMSMFAQAFAAEGQLLGQTDGPPLGLRPDLLKLPAGWHITDERTIGIESGKPAEVLLGLYDFASGERFEAQTAAGEPLPDNAVRLMVEDCS